MYLGLLASCGRILPSERLVLSLGRQEAVKGGLEVALDDS